MRKIADSEPWRIPATIEDPTALDEVRDALRRLGYAR
jgi:propionyl-CoA synthetase